MIVDANKVILFEEATKSSVYFKYHSSEEDDTAQDLTEPKVRSHRVSL